MGAARLFVLIFCFVLGYLFFVGEECFCEAPRGFGGARFLFLLLLDVVQVPLFLSRNLIAV